ncbi:histidine phosphatase family protein [Bacillus piscicola]|uniref:histidine phosphatase family protein n=1 Tax=Bacillus piscicola TaxID=1632684 RepID=UPI001F0923F2|nr:histidine phosphatase family protein [Bacillus piscicola]
MEIYLIRHAQSLGNISGTIQGCQDVLLSEEGKKQADLLSRYFMNVELDRLYSSDLIRAQETAKALEKHQKVKAETIPMIREVNLGPLQGKTRQQIYEEYPETRKNNILQSGIEGTESEKEITERCYQFYKLLRGIKEGEKAAFVSHGGFLTIFLMYLLAGEKWHTLHRPFYLENTGVSKLSWTKEKLSIHYINQYHHLIK